MVHDEDIRQQLMLGEDSKWEFKQVEFKGNQLVGPHKGRFAAAMIAFANKSGGRLLVGVADDGALQGLSREQMDVLVKMLAEIGSDIVKPPLPIDVYRRNLDGRAFVLVEVPRGHAVHEYKQKSWIRTGASKRPLIDPERMRLVQNRAQGQHTWNDHQPISGTGFGTLDSALWKPILSAEGLKDPEAGLAKLALLAENEVGVQCATVAGLLLCTEHPEQWLPGAIITATHYRGTDRTTGQVDAQEITGPLQEQIADTLTFVARNMRVVVRGSPARVDMPQYSEKAVFEAVVNAVAHRDYSIKGSTIRLSMFSDRLELQSPGALPDSLTIESMLTRQVTRNQAVTFVLSRMKVDGIRGFSHPRHFMERRGDGVPVIVRETQEISGTPAEYRLIDDAEVMLRIPAGPRDVTFSATVERGIQH